MKPVLRDLLWILPASLGTGALLSALSGGTWWIGWLAYAFIFLLGFSALAALWRGAGAVRTLGLVLLLTVFARLAVGMAYSYILPAYGYDKKIDRGGYVLQDAFDRDSQAWDLAHSGAPLTKAFDKSYSKDQYGGLLVFSAAVYRGLSPDAHRPWLIILIGALTSAVGVALAWKAARQLWGEAVAVPAVWIMALLPESVLLGSSQMREPFLITLTAMLFWGMVAWQLDRTRRAWFWMAGALAGMLVVSPSMAVFALLGMGVWFWLISTNKRISWGTVLIVAGVLVAALALLWLGLARGVFSGASPMQVFGNWLQQATQYDVTRLLENSGWVQRVFQELPEGLHMPFITAYGIAQPVLPAAIFDTAPWPWQATNIILAAGWYALLPFLVAGLLAVWRVPEKHERSAWIWMWVFTWAWMIFSAYRAAGDQWDNPRYRIWFLLWEAFLAAKTLSWWQATRNAWMGRILIVEGIFLAFFSFWYSSRYGTWAKQPLHLFTIILAIVVTGLVILIAGLIWDSYRRKRKKRA